MTLGVTSACFEQAIVATSTANKALRIVPPVGPLPYARGGASYLGKIVNNCRRASPARLNRLTSEAVQGTSACAARSTASIASAVSQRRSRTAWAAPRENWLTYAPWFLYSVPSRV